MTMSFMDIAADLIAQSSKTSKKSFVRVPKTAELCGLAEKGMFMYQNSSIKTRNIVSANSRHLVYSIIMIVMLIALESVAVWHCFFRAGFPQDVGLLAIMQIPVMLVSLVPLTHLPAFKNRASFNIYFSKIEDADMKNIKENYYICYIDEYGVLFVDKKNANLYHSWALIYEINSTRAVEEAVFAEEV